MELSFIVQSFKGRYRSRGLGEGYCTSCCVPGGLCSQERRDWTTRLEMGHLSLVEMINYAQFCTYISMPPNITYANTTLIA